MRLIVRLFAIHFLYLSIFLISSVLLPSTLFIEFDHYNHHCYAHRRRA